MAQSDYNTNATDAVPTSIQQQQKNLNHGIIETWSLMMSLMAMMMKKKKMMREFFQKPVLHAESSTT